MLEIITLIRNTRPLIQGLQLSWALDLFWFLKVIHLCNYIVDSKQIFFLKDKNVWQKTPRLAFSRLHTFYVHKKVFKKKTHGKNILTFSP